MTDNSQNSPEETVVCALYHFVSIDDCEALQQSLLSLLKREGVKGTLLVAAEGINGTVAGTSEGIEGLQAFLSRDGRFEGIAYKLSTAAEMPFPRTRVKLKKEIDFFFKLHLIGGLNGVYFFTHLFEPEAFHLVFISFIKIE